MLMITYIYIYILQEIIWSRRLTLLKNISRQNGKYHISYHNNITYLYIQIKIPSLMVGEKLQGKRKLTVNETMGTKEGSWYGRWLQAMSNISREKWMCSFHFLCLFFPFEQMLLSLGKVSPHKVNSKTWGLLLLIYALIVFCIKKLWPLPSS